MRARLLTILAVYTRIHAQTVPRERKKTELGAVVRVCTALDFIFTHTQNKQTKEITNTLSTGTGVCASQIAPVAIRPSSPWAKERWMLPCQTRLQANAYFKEN